MNRPKSSEIPHSIWVAAALTALFTAGQLWAADLPSGDSSQVEARGISEMEYGDLFLSQQKDAIETPWFLGLGYQYGFNNPYLNVHGIQTQLGYRFGRFFQLGAAFTFMANNETGLAERLRIELGAQGIDSRVARPFFNSELQVGVIPLSGVVNLFSLKAVTLELPILVGLGASRYSNRSQWDPSLSLAIQPQIFFTPRLGAQLSLRTRGEHFGAGEWQNRVEAGIGFIGRL